MLDPNVLVRLCERHSLMCLEEGFDKEGMKTLLRRYRVATNIYTSQRAAKTASERGGGGEEREGGANGIDNVDAVTTVDSIDLLTAVTAPPTAPRPPSPPNAGRVGGGERGQCSEPLLSAAPNVGSCAILPSCTVERAAGCQRPSRGVTVNKTLWA